MTQFLGTHEFKLDAKGRVSIPGAFRTALAKAGTDEIILRPSHLGPFVEGWPPAVFEAICENLQNYDTFSEQGDDLATVLFAQAHLTRHDSEGRLVLPDALRQHIGVEVGALVSFVGKGRKFEIWDVARGAKDTETAMNRAREARLTLSPRRPAP